MKLIYSELRNVIKEIAEFDSLNQKEYVEEKRSQVIKAMKDLMLICLLARKEGLLALEEYAHEKLSKQGMEKVLFTAILLVVDGTDPEYVEDIMTMKFYSGGYTGYDALTYFIYLKGMLSVQQGMNPRIIEEELLAMLPENMEDYLKTEEDEEYWGSKILSAKEEEEFFEVTTEPFEEKKERFCNYSPALSINEDGALNILFASNMIAELSDRSMQRALREIDNHELALALKGLDSAARTKVITNLSASLASLIIDDSELKHYVTVPEVGKKCLSIIRIIHKLSDYGEISMDFSEGAGKLIKELDKLETPYEALETEKCKLHKLMWEYLRESKKERYL